uniref:Uncharacterized protein n=1 Tax=Megaselia scalaris TaxID=36166 RepID=T1GLA2_MEGSC
MKYTCKLSLNIIFGYSRNYINIRTGTHYFPKSINTLAIETQRFKFGLNKIEEMSPQDPYDIIYNIYQFDSSVLLKLTSIPFFENQADYAQVSFNRHLFDIPDFCKIGWKILLKLAPAALSSSAMMPLTLLYFISDDPSAEIANI